MSCHGDTFYVTLLLGVSHLLQLVFVSFFFLSYFIFSVHGFSSHFPFFYVQVQFLSHAIFLLLFCISQLLFFLIGAVRVSSWQIHFCHGKLTRSSLLFACAARVGETWDGLVILSYFIIMFFCSNPVLASFISQYRFPLSFYSFSHRRNRTRQVWIFTFFFLPLCCFDTVYNNKLFLSFFIFPRELDAQPLITVAY